MSQMPPRMMALGTAMALLSVCSLAPAQTWHPNGSVCVPQTTYYCTAAQPAYVNVPVTEYREERRVVQKPVVETKYVERPVTVYEPVTENKTTQIPTVTYQNVTEYQNIQQDVGHWTAQFNQRQVLSPWQYDSSPGLIGLINRVSYTVRMAFTPQFSVTHAYRPMIVSQNVPVTRRVATHGTRTVNYRVTRYVPKTTTRRVAVNTVRMVNQEIITRRPVTVMRSIPIGSTTTASLPFVGPTQTVTAPAPDPISTAKKPTAGRRSDLRPRSRSADQRDEFEQGSQIQRRDRRDAIEADGASFLVPSDSTDDQIGSSPLNHKSAAARLADYRVVASSRHSVVRVGRWVAHHKTSAAESHESVSTENSHRIQGPAFPQNMIAAVQYDLD